MGSAGQERRESSAQDTTERGVGALAAVDARRRGTLLIDAVDVAEQELPRLITRLADQLSARRLVVLHPTADPASLGDVQVVTDVSGRDQLAARIGPGRVVRVVPTDQAAMLVGDVPRPLVLTLPADAADLGNGPSPVPEGPVFIGGTGRSGTKIIGRMVGAHPRFVTVHTELRFHAKGPGFGAVLAGEKTPKKFAEIVETRWYGLVGGSGHAKGLQLITSKTELGRHLRRFVERSKDDVPGALGQLLLDTIGPYARGRDGLSWAETTPSNCAAADALTAVLPNARVVNTIRDGRDVAASVVTMPWGPDTFDEALDWWAKGVEAAHRGMVNADPARVRTVRLEELIHFKREETYADLVEFLGFGDDTVLRTFFDERMSAEGGHVGRWRKELDEDQQIAFDRRYRNHLQQLDAAGVTLPVDPDLMDELARN